MIKYLIGLLVSILAVTFVRAVMALLVKGAKEALQADAQPGGPSKASSGQPPESGTRLRKCKSCGTFAPETRMLRHSTREVDVFYCSKECEKKAAA
jgi:hypothetical protein